MMAVAKKVPSTAPTTLLDVKQSAVHSTAPAAADDATGGCCCWARHTAGNKVRQVKANLLLLLLLVSSSIILSSSHTHWRRRRRRLCTQEKKTNPKFVCDDKSYFFLFLFCFFKMNFDTAPAAPLSFHAFKSDIEAQFLKFNPWFFSFWFHKLKINNQCVCVW